MTLRAPPTRTRNLAYRSGSISTPIPVWRGDRDYYGLSDPRRAAHLAEIEAHGRIDARIDAASGDHSYAVRIERRDIP